MSAGSSVLFDAPGPRARVRNRLISGVTVVVVLLIAWLVFGKLQERGQLTAAKWEPFLTSNLWTTYVLPGVKGTLTAAAVSIVLALVLGFVLGVGRLSALLPSQASASTRSLTVASNSIGLGPYTTPWLHQAAAITSF